MLKDNYSDENHAYCEVMEVWHKLMQHISILRVILFTIIADEKQRELPIMNKQTI